MDEIGEIPREMQVKLLRVLQEGEFERVGGTKTIRSDVRIISATNKILSEEVQKKNFREDLYYRLNVIFIELPPLRERKEDIPVLAEYFIKEFSKKNYKNIEKITPKALEILTDYDWPGNIRELRNVIERMVVLSSQTVLELPDIPQDISGGKLALSEQGIPETVNLKEAEKDLIVKKLNRVSGNKSKAAQELGISRRTLYRKLLEYNIPL